MEEPDEGMWGAEDTLLLSLCRTPAQLQELREHSTLRTAKCPWILIPLHWGQQSPHKDAPDCHVLSASPVPDTLPGA